MLVTAVAVTSLVVVPSDPVGAVSTGRPTAVAVAADGTSYVGFANAAGLLVLAADGSPAGSFATGGPVTALAAEPSGGVWVDDGSVVTRLSRSGAVLASFPHRPAASCAADADRYGGLAVTTARVYVAERCLGSVGVYTRAGGLLATVDLPGSGSPRGIAWAPAYGKVPARLYVSVPDAGKVYGYDAARLSGRSKPVVTVTGSRPGGLAADDRGHLAVLDSTTNGLYLYDARRRYRQYRTLGHPPTAATTKGYLSRPAAIAQGGATAGRHFWVADTGNGRVQRWNSAGTTQWMADTRLPDAPEEPDDPGDPGDPGTPTEPDPPSTPVTTCRGTPSVRIDAGGRVARKPYVTLVVRAPEGAQEVLISNDGFKHSDRKTLTSSCRYPWTLEGGAGRRPKVVSVRFPGVSGAASDRVLLDGAPPVIHRVTAKWVTARRGWVVRIRATDRGTGIAYAKVGKTRSSTRRFSWPADIVSWDSSQLRWIQVVDRTGLRSRWYRLRL
ncbi:hypothetical protein ASC77_07470 [Nocardioides sp. Root1257]|nr:hypothetical protein ASC77_07470 [Nocardioides sp. Root1257]KRC47753.1 hypothetical protein ASE24_07475 [Nocardioides sp. Root224]